MTAPSLLKLAQLYQEMCFRWLRARRDHQTNEPPPEPPKQLQRSLAAKIFDDCEREFNRGAK
jgi:hypothetical protein